MPGFTLIHAVADRVRLSDSKGEPWMGTTVEGKIVVACHGEPYGVIHGFPKETLEKADFIICCFPKSVKEANPCLNIVGNWDSPTETWISDSDTVYPFIKIV